MYTCFKEMYQNNSLFPYKYLTGGKKNRSSEAVIYNYFKISNIIEKQSISKKKIKCRFLFNAKEKTETFL